MLVAGLILSIVWEWVHYVLPTRWKYRRQAVVGPVILSSFTSAGLVLAIWSPLAAVLLLISAFRIFNQLRIVQARMHEAYLIRVTRRTGLVLGCLQLLLLAVIYYVTFAWTTLFMLLAALQVFFGLLVLVSLLRNLVKTKYRVTEGHYSDKDLPSVTVAIPARNETNDLEACLRSILASDYPKLEILVLDDCSQDKTAEIIRSFAHDGVRFVKGYEPADRWLAKNQAYDKLADDASGELVLFCGVDVRLGPGAIRALVTTVLERKKDMISVMPRRLSAEPLAAFIQPMRYWWELVPPRRYFNRPPVLSTGWIIRRKSLKKLGGMEAVQHAIIPEGYFARELVKSDGYSFIRSNDQLDVQTQKKLAQQRETAVRMRYPQIRRRPEWVLLISLMEVLFLLGPFALLASSLWAGFGTVQILAALAGGILVFCHVLVVQVTNPGNVLIAIFNFPLAVLTELFVGYESMLRYEFSTVEWKGRNICIPVMHVYPKLPDVEG